MKQVALPTPVVPIVGASLLVFLFSSYLPMPILNLLVGNHFGVAAILIGVLFVFRKNIVLGLAVGLAAASLFLEHRRRLVMRVQEAMGAASGRGAPVAELDRGSPDVVRGERHPDAADHSYEDYNYEPAGAKGGEEAHGSGEAQEDVHADAPHLGIGDSVNDKAPMPTVPSNSGSAGDFFQNRGLARPFEASNSA
jgi:hypothetical protein